MIEEIATNLYKIEIPLPMNMLNSVNSYVIKAPNRNLIIDTGMNLEECMKVMQASLKKLGVDLGKTDYFITHFHGDHFGLVLSLITDQSIIYFNKPESEIIDRIRDRTFMGNMINFTRMSGFPENEIENIFPPSAAYEYKFKGPVPFRFMEDGDPLSIGDYQLEFVKTSGHSKGHMGLYEPNKKIFISGDHLLGDITPSIQLRSDDENPLKEYFLSLDKVNELDIELVLPGHRRIFKNCKVRIKEIKDHHQERANEIISLLEEGNKNAYQVASRMTWNVVDCDSWNSFPALQKFFATGEAIAHLKYLEEKGMVNKEMQDQRIVYSINLGDVRAESA